MLSCSYSVLLSITLCGLDGKVRICYGYTFSSAVSLIVDEFWTIVGSAVACLNAAEFMLDCELLLFSSTMISSLTFLVTSLIDGNLMFAESMRRGSWLFSFWVSVILMVASS